MSDNKQLMGRVNGWVTGINSSGRNGLIIVRDCLQHMNEHGDWTPLARLMSKAPTAHKSNIRLIVGRVLQGWTVSQGVKEGVAEGAKSIFDRQVVFKKVKGKNQGFDDVQMAKLQLLIDSQTSILSGKIREVFKAEKAEKAPKAKADLLTSARDRLVKWCKENGITPHELALALEVPEGQPVIEVEPNF